MSPHRLQEDVIDRLEEAKKRIIYSMILIHEHANDYPANLADAMCALCEIELALGELRHEKKSDKPDDDNGNGAIRGMVETLASRRPAS